MIALSNPQFKVGDTITMKLMMREKVCSPMYSVFPFYHGYLYRVLLWYAPKLSGQIENPTYSPSQVHLNCVYVCVCVYLPLWNYM